MIFHDGSAGKRVFSSTSALGEPHAQASTRFFLIFFLYHNEYRRMAVESGGILGSRGFFLCSGLGLYQCKLLLSEPFFPQPTSAIDYLRTSSLRPSISSSSFIPPPPPQQITTSSYFSLSLSLPPSVLFRSSEEIFIAASFNMILPRVARAVSFV